MPSWRSDCADPCHVSVAQNQGALTSQQVVETTLDRVIQTVAAAVFIVIFDFVTASFTLIAGTLSDPSSSMSYSRCTPVVVSSVMP